MSAFLAAYFALFPVINLLLLVRKLTPAHFKALASLGRISEEPHTSIFILFFNCI